MGAEETDILGKDPLIDLTISLEKYCLGGTTPHQSVKLLRLIDKEGPNNKKDGALIETDFRVMLNVNTNCDIGQADVSYRGCVIRYSTSDMEGLMGKMVTAPSDVGLYCYNIVVQIR